MEKANIAVDFKVSKNFMYFILFNGEQWYPL